MSMQGDPPGTRWLKRQKQQPKQPSNIELVDDPLPTPREGVLQYGIKELGTGGSSVGWYGVKSPPHSDQWQLASTPLMPLNVAQEWLKKMRTVGE
jgi:hypothetical protein